MDAIAEIKSRIPIEELVSRYVQLKKVGRQFKALCPFHKERTPSFYVSPERQLAYCFGCRKGGDHFKFIQEIENLDFRGALAMLAERAGVELPKTTPLQKEQRSQRDRLLEAHEYATQFFEEQLWNGSDGKKILSYLKKRGLSEETIKKARLGFVSGENRGNSDHLYKFLLEKNFTRAEILASGLAIARDTQESECIDRFRMRLMFPIQNVQGAVCAFGGRAVKDGDEPKYLNSPETALYQKSSLLFLLPQAREAIREKKSVIIVEGYMDALTAHQAGFTNTVAASGTALTEVQLILLKRFTSDVIFAFDRDNAGKLATERACTLALAQEFSIRIAVWEGEYKDPDECIREKPKFFAAAIENAFSISDYLFAHFAEQFDAKTIEGKKKIAENLLPFWNQIKNSLELEEWLKKASRRLDISLQSLFDELKRFQGKQKTLTRLATPGEETGISTERVTLEEYLLGLLLTYKELHSVINHIITPEDFTEIELQNIYRLLSSEYNQPGALSSQITPEEENRCNLLRLYIESKHTDMQWDNLKEEVIATATSLLKRRLTQEKRTLVSRLRDAQGKEKEQLLTEYQELLERGNKLWPKS